MASSFNAGRIIQGFVDQAPKYTPIASRCSRILPVPDASGFRLGGRAIGGTANTLASTATSTTLSDSFTFETSFSVAKKYVHHKIPLFKLNNDYALQNAGVDMFNAMSAAMDQDFVAGMVGLLATNHPRAGAGAGQVGAGKKYLDTGLKKLQGEAGEFTQDNLLTSALAEDALNNAIALLLGQKGDRGNALGVGANGGLVLCVAPAKAKVAHELVKSTLSGSDYASNFVNGIITDVVVSPYFADSDEDDWFLCDPQFNPCVYGVAEAPKVEVNLSDDGQFVHIVGSWVGAFGYSPYEYGIIASNVA